MEKKGYGPQYQQQVLYRFRIGLIEHFSNHTTKKEIAYQGYLWYESHVVT
jgi:hypothetical protein